MTRTQRDKLLSAFFSATLFLSAMLMFSVQPMAGKMLLPLVGGAPSGWIVAMAFFQVMLLAGYFYAHALARLTPLRHGLCYAAALLFGCLFLPVHIAPGPSAPGAFGVFCLLTTALAAPFIALSATSSTLQRLFTATGHRSAGDPYFLYAASNLGSFTGLFLYPLVFEHAWGLTRQTQYWLFGYMLLIAAAAICLLPAAGKARKKGARTAKTAPEQKNKDPLTNRLRLQWVILAFFPSALLCAVTTHISTDIFSAPMLWVLPLSLYLLTFVAAFAKKQLVPLARMADLQPVIVAVAIAFLMMFNSLVRMSWYAVAVQLIAFSAVALLCHMRLAALRPLKNESQLTEFYLMLSVGGALGGVLNAFILPVTLDRLIEYPLLLVLSCLINPGFAKRAPELAKKAFAAAMILVLVYVCYLRGDAGYVRSLKVGSISPEMLIADGLLFLIMLLLSMNIRALLAGGMIMVLLIEFIIPREVVLSRRDFYGVLSVLDYPMEIPGKPGKAPGEKTDARVYTARYLNHGTTAHGMQIRDPALETATTTYYWRNGPAGEVFSLYKPKDVAVLGLGAGTMNCYSTPQNAFTFFEIDPAVVEIAADTRYFTFLSACKARRPPLLITGDGRLELAKLDEKFDLVVLDAFSSDTVPAHLLTTDAIKLYLSHLKTGGVLLFNVSNRYFNVNDVLARNAAELGLAYRYKVDIPGPLYPYASTSRWFAIAGKGASLAPLDRKGWFVPAPPEQLRIWTDDYTNLLSVLKFSNFQPSAQEKPAKAQ